MSTTRPNPIAGVAECQMCGALVDARTPVHYKSERPESTRLICDRCLIRAEKGNDLRAEDETDSHIEPQQESMAGSRIASMTDDELRASIVIDERQANLWPHGSEVRESLMDELRMLRIERNRRLQRKRNRPQLKCIRRYKTKDQYYLVINWNEDKPLPESLELRITKRDAELLTAHGLPYSPLTY